MSPSRTVIARPPPASASRSAGWRGSNEKSQGRPDAVRRIASTRGSSAFSTAQPLGRVILVIVAFTSASWSTVGIPCRSRWSADTFVTTATSLCCTPIPRSRIPPRAVSSTATSGCCASAVAAPPNPGVVARLHAAGRCGRRRRSRRTRPSCRTSSPCGRGAASSSSCRSSPSPGSRGRPGRDHGLGAGVGRATLGGELGDHPGGRSPERGAHRGGDGAGERLGRAPPAPGERDRDPPGTPAPVRPRTPSRPGRSPPRSGG